MSNIKISEMTEATSLGDSDLLTIVQGGVNKKITKTNAMGNVITALNNPTYVTGTGNSVTLNDTRVGPIKQTIKGETTQTTYTGSNLMSSAFEQGARSNTTGGGAFYSTNYVRTINPITVSASTKYTVALNGVLYAGDIHFFNGETFLSRVTSNETFTTPSNCDNINVQFFNANGITTSDMGLPQLNKGEAIQPYEPYVRTEWQALILITHKK